MNKFRNNLHSAFFFPGSNWNGEFYKHLEETPEAESGLSEEEARQEEVEQRQAVETAANERDEALESSRQAVSEIVDDATKAQSTLEHVDNVFGVGYSSVVLNEIYKRKNDWTLDRAKVTQVQGRIAENIKLGSVWEKNIQDWYKHLLQTLLDNKYFRNPFHRTEEEIRRMYTKVVRSQYEHYVWDMDDQKFAEIKWELFWRNMADYPANVVYEELNKTGIFANELWNKQSYTVEAKNTDNFESNLKSVEAQTWGDKKRFLTRDLPNYLWETKDTSVFSRILQWTPIISKSNDRRSEEDKKWIGRFMDAVEKISVRWEQKPELALLESFKDAQSNWTEYQWQEKFAENDIYVQTEKDMKKVIEAGRFYVKSQRVDLPVEDQHNLYLSILGVIEHEWWVDRAIAQFMDDVNEYNENKIAESKKQNDADGEILQQNHAELFNIADKFNKRYTRALNLSKMDESSFQNRLPVAILADLNNDWALNFSDKWVTKTWFEFQKLAEMVGEQNAINHLIDQAKIMNQTMELGLTDDDLKYEEIQKWNKKLILVLQNIISQPWGDLYPLLMYGTDSAQKYKEAFDRLPESKDDPIVQAAADELLKDINIEDLKSIEWVDYATDREWLRQAVAWRLFSEYTRWVWLWGTLSFDEWVKWVSLNGWVQVSESGLSAWLTLGYNPEIDLWKWRSITPGASFWFVPLFHAAVWWSVEIAKRWINEKSVANKIWLRVWFTKILGVSDIYSASLWWSRDKLAGIEWDRHNIESQFNSQIMVPLMNSIADKLWDNKVLDLDNETVRSQVREAIAQKVESVLKPEEKSKLKQWDKEKLIDNTIRFLSFFDKADLSNEGVRKAIASKMAEQYAYAREDERLNNIDGETYVSGVRIWFSWVQLWVYGVWVIHAWLSSTKHEHDMYGDRSYGRYGISAESFRDFSSLDKDAIDEFNKKLPEGKKLSLNPDWFVVVPRSLLRDVYINPGMKGLLKKDESGNILLHPETHVDLPVRTVSSSTESTRINVGWMDANMVRLSEVTDDWFTDWDIDTSKLTGKENIFSKERLDRELNRLKANYPEDQDLQNYEFDEDILSGLERGKKYRIILVKDWSWISTKIEETTEWRWLSIEYEPLDKKMLVGKEATIVANDTYAEALKVTSNALYNISHDRNNRLNPEYRAFANAVKDQNYEAAKATILAMLPKMDDYINKYQSRNNRVYFGKTKEGKDSKAVTLLRELEWAELWKALMSINNVFARVSSVHWGTDWLYHFKIYDSVNQRLLDRNMWSIVEARAKEISWKIDRSNLDDDAKAAYKNLIAFAEEYRKNNPDKYSDTKKQAKTLENAIWINLWNAINIENPLFNPEVYADSVIENPEFDWVDVLKKRALNLVAWNKALMSPVLESLWFDENASIDLENARYENWQLSLDINGKNVILKANMKIALFAQCVNHMLILDSISAEIPWEKRKVEFGASVMWDGALYESTLGNQFTSSRTSGDMAVTVVRTGSEEEEPAQDTETEPEATERPTEPQNPGWSTPWADDWWSVPSSGTWTPSTGWEWQGGSQWGGRNGEWGGEWTGSWSWNGEWSWWSGGIDTTTSGSWQSGWWGGKGRG